MAIKPLRQCMVGSYCRDFEIFKVSDVVLGQISEHAPRVSFLCDLLVYVCSYRYKGVCTVKLQGYFGEPTTTDSSNSVGYTAYPHGACL